MPVGTVSAPLHALHGGLFTYGRQEQPEIRPTLPLFQLLVAGGAEEESACHHCPSHWMSAEGNAVWYDCPGHWMRIENSKREKYYSRLHVHATRLPHESISNFLYIYACQQVAS
jgi:hypothetical protein